MRRDPAALVSALLIASGLLLIAAEAQAQWLWYPYERDVARSRSYSSGHKAIDFASSCGTTIYAAYEGRVSAVVESNSCRSCYGCYSGSGSAYVDGACRNNYIYIDHPNGYQTRYLHIERNGASVNVGDQVRAGQPIGRSGNTGWTCGSTGCHLHFVLRNPSGVDVDPDAGFWTSPLRYGNSRDTTPPTCQFPNHPGTETILRDPELQVDWRVRDPESGLRGVSQSWNEPIPQNSDPQFSNGNNTHEGYVKIGWASVGRNRAYVRAWNNEGLSCQADLGEFWYYPEPFLRSWLIAGPLATDGGERDRLADAPLGDEAALLPRPGPATDTVAWQILNSDEDRIALQQLLGDTDHALAYAATWCYNPGDPRDVDIHVGSDDGFRLLLNGEVLAEDPEPRGAEPDQDLVRGTLLRGWSLLLIKVEEKTGSWRFYMRLSEPDSDDHPSGVTCQADFSTGPCQSDDTCPGDTVCRGDRCQAPLPQPEPEPDVGAADTHVTTLDASRDAQATDASRDVAQPDAPSDAASPTDAPEGLLRPADQAIEPNCGCDLSGERPTSAPAWLIVAVAALTALTSRRR